MVVVRYRSPTRTVWSYNALGLTQLVLAILAATDEATAERFYQRVQVELHRAERGGPVNAGFRDILGWLGSAAVTDDVVRVAVEGS